MFGSNKSTHNEPFEWPFRAGPYGTSGSDASSPYYSAGYGYEALDLGDKAFDSWYRGGDGTGYDTRSRGSRVRDDYRGVSDRGVARPPPPSPSVHEEYRHLNDRDMVRPQEEVGSDLRLDLDVSFKTSVLGGEKLVRMRHMEACGTCYGNWYERGCPTCGGQGMTEVVKEIRVRIPPGMENGNRLCMAGEGDAGRNGGPSGDLYIFVNVQDDPNFRQEGSDIYSEHTISFVDAILGASIVTPVVDGLATIEVPPGTQCGQVLRLRGNGATLVEDRSLRGDHFVTINVDIPQDLSMEDEELLRKMRQNKLNSLHP